MDTSFLLRSARSKFPAHTALCIGETALTYSELDDRVDAIAAGLRSAASAEGPIASLLLNDLDTVALYLGVARGGLVNAPINFRLTDDEVCFILNDCDARTLIVDGDQRGRVAALLEKAPKIDLVVVVGDAPAGNWLHLDELVRGWDGGPVRIPIADDADASIIYSSGTSGFPKGVVRSHRANLWGVVNAFIGSPRTTSDVELFVLPLFGIGFVAQLLPTMLAGGKVVLDRIFDPGRTWELLQTHRVTRGFIAPTMIASMLDVDDHERFDVSALKTLSVAYEFAPVLRDQTVARFGDVLLNMYGLTEAQLCCTAPGEYPTDPTSVGQPMGLARLFILDADGNEAPPGTTGEIGFEAPTVMTRYLGNPDATSEARTGDQLRTGDLGYLDAHSRLHFAGRLKEIVKSGGFNIDPVEVENALLEYPGVREAALIGVPDERWGERAVAYVAGSADLDGADIAQHCRGRIAGFKVPKEVFVLDTLPKNATGKIHRAALRAQWL
jgi:fatty-acyl-CoA synthase